MITDILDLLLPTVTLAFGGSAAAPMPQPTPIDPLIEQEKIRKRNIANTETQRATTAAARASTDVAGRQLRVEQQMVRGAESMKRRTALQDTLL